jgi:hypothetical protein
VNTYKELAIYKYYKRISYWHLADFRHVEVAGTLAGIRRRDMKFVQFRHPSD